MYHLLVLNDQPHQGLQAGLSQLLGEVTGTETLLSGTEEGEIHGHLSLED